MGLDKEMPPGKHEQLEPAAGLLLPGDQLIVLDKEIKSFTDITGACERIRNTPIPYSYNLFLKKFIFVYTITMPFGLVYDFNTGPFP